MKTLKIKTLLASLLLLNSCSYGLPLKTNYTSPTTNTYQKAIKTYTVYIKTFEDLRETKNFNNIGEINEVVADLSSNNLTLDTKVSNLVTGALKKEFIRSGFTLTNDGGEDDSTDYIIEGVIKKFELNIDSRDAISIVIDYKIWKTRDSTILFNGSAQFSDDRFIGITGNTRKSINKYLNDALYNISSQVIESTGLVLKTKITVPTNKKTVSNYIEPEQFNTSKTAPINPNNGTLTISSTPVKVKVYIEDIYYGLTPLSVNIKSGIYNISFKKKGFKSDKEKVSVRMSEDTVMEVELNQHDE